MYKASQIEGILNCLVIFGSPLSYNSEAQKFQRGQDLPIAEPKKVFYFVIPKYKRSFL